MNKLLQGIIIIIITLTVSFFHPLNSAEKNTYVFTPVDTIVKLKDVKIIGTYVEWKNISDIKDIIDQYYIGGNSNAGIVYKQYLKAQLVVPVEPGYYSVVFAEEYKGFWIFILGNKI